MGGVINCTNNCANVSNNQHWNFASHAAPTNPVFSAVYLSSLTVTWGSVASELGYLLTASTDSN